MNKLLSSLLIIMVAQTACSVQNNATNKSNKEVSRTEIIATKFSGLKTSNGISVVFTYAPGASQTTCVIKGVEDLANRVKPRVENGTLFIATIDSKGIYYGRPDDGRPAPVVTVTCPYLLNSVESNSGSTLSINKDLRMAPEVTLQVNSGGVCSIKRLTGVSAITVDASSGGILTAGCAGDDTGISINASSGAEVTLSGTASAVAVNANSGAVVNLYGLKSADLSGTATSGSIIKHSGKSARLKANSGAIISTR